MRSVLVTGFAPHTGHLCRLLNEHATDVRATYYGDTRFELIRAVAHASYADAWIMVGGPLPNELLRSIFEFRGRPAIMLWIGSDVTTIAERPSDLEQLHLRDIVHWATAPHLIEELAALGISARYVPTAAAAVPSIITPMPSAFTVMTYLPAPRREFYGQKYVWKAASALPDVKFFVVGRGEPEHNSPPNVEYLGQVSDMESRLDAASVLLRLTRHDSLSQGVIEALARGRHVIWTYPYPGVIYTRSPNEAIDSLLKLREAHHAGLLSTNETGLRQVCLAHNPNDVAARIIAALEDAIRATKKPSRDHAKRTLAISGQDIPAARVASNCSRYSLELQPRLLSTSDRTGTIISAIRLLTSDAWYTIGDPFAPATFEFAAFLTNKRRVIHWVGSDVDMLTQKVSLLRKFRSRRFTHLAQNDEIARRLSQVGLPSYVVPLSTFQQVDEVRELPRVLTLLLYLPARNSDFFGRRHYERMMRSLSDEPLHYIVIGGGAISAPANVSVEELGWRHDISSTYERATALLQLDNAESIPTMVIEALLHGRYVLYSNDFPFTARVCDYDALEIHVRELLKQHSQGLLMPHIEAAKAMNGLYSPVRCLHLLAEACGFGETRRPFAHTLPRKRMGSK